MDTSLSDISGAVNVLLFDVETMASLLKPVYKKLGMIVQ